MTGFKDLFSEHSSAYSQFRPIYPESLFSYLAAQCRQRRHAWDCATGNGQAAVGLARHFEKVHATDASEEQLKQAVAGPRVEYHRAPAERSGLAGGWADLITVAQALHWFKFDAFYAEARRVARPDGALLAVWCYGLMEIEPAIDPLILRYYVDDIGRFWDPERKWVDGLYRTLPFPFPELKVPSFEMAAEWTLEHLTGYLHTWSATRKAARALGSDPMAGLAAPLAAAWGDPARTKTVRWPLAVRVGRVST